MLFRRSASEKPPRIFFPLAAEQPGYRSRIRYSDADYFRLSEKDTRIAKATRPRPVPTSEQIESVLERSPVGTRRDLIFGIMP
jgi:hypothetical protein